jgi:hypothetical protein
VRAVAAGETTQVAAARQLGCTPKTVATYVERFRREQHKPAATPEQHDGKNGGNGAARATISAARPAKAKACASTVADPALAARLWQRATELNSTMPWRVITEEFGINAALAKDHCAHGPCRPTSPPPPSRGSWKCRQQANRSHAMASHCSVLAEAFMLRLRPA